MKLDDLVWAKNELRKLHPELYLALTVVASDEEIKECLRDSNLSLYSSNLSLYSQTAITDHTILGMKIEKQPKGWHVRDEAGNTIGKS